ncbi:MAG: putative DNA binding domain-containing protein [Saprospiraceae bacterium]|nr:putative DNA binding domain-containing protein [Saprospiraceae bacterium]
MLENEQIEKKSLLVLTKASPDWDELAKDCVCFANAQGGRIFFGIEDKASLPEPTQRIPALLPARLAKEVQQRTLNVSVVPQIKTADNGGEFIELLVQRSATSIAGTSNGRYYVRVSDECKPLLPDELSRLLVDKNAFTWETQPFRKVGKEDADPKKLSDFINDVRHSNRVSAFVRDKTADELLEYYFLVSGEYLTNLGALWIGKREHRANLLYAPIIQFIKYDENEQKVRKRMWDDYELNPKELIQSVWHEIPEWQDGIEIPDGIFRKTVANYDEVVVRELLANALVHRPYTIRGDLFINLYNDRMEVHNPGLLPLGVTPQNILHKSVMRNPLRENDNLKDWLGKLTDLGLVKTRGKTKGTVYFVNPVLLKKLDFRGLMNLKNIEPIRLRELIRQILTNYGDCSISDIQDRVGKEITKPHHVNWIS